MDNPLLNMEDAQRRIEAWKARSDRFAADTQEASRQLQSLEVTATDDNRTVEITIDSGGRLVDIQLSSRIQRQSPEHTQAAILETYRKAQAMLAESAAEIVGDTLGTGSATGRAFLAGFAGPGGSDESERR